MLKALENIDLANDQTFVDGTPHHLFTSLRHEAPVYWNPRSDGGPGIWCITKHADIAQIGREWQTFTSTRGVNITRISIEEQDRMANTLLIFMDPPRHTRLRSVVNAAFSPRRLAGLEPLIRREAHTAVNRVIERGECNFFDVAADLPIRMICNLMGIPEEDHMRVLDWTNRTFGREDPEYVSGPEDTERAYQEMFAYGMQMAIARRSHPTDDLMSAIAHAQIDGEPVTDMELMYLFFLFAGAGNDTTRTLILNSMLLFAAHKSPWQQLRADRSLIGNALEEVLRMEPSVRGMGRTVTVDTQVRDVTLKAGDHLYLWYVSSNRDEEVFDKPHEFDIRRINANKHQAFGGGGVHFCVGAQLARMQTRLLLDILLDRMPEYELAGAPVYARSIQFNTLKQLPIRFKPGPKC